LLGLLLVALFHLLFLGFIRLLLLHFLVFLILSLLELLVFLLLLRAELVLLFLIFPVEAGIPRARRNRLGVRRSLAGMDYSARIRRPSGRSRVRLGGSAGGRTMTSGSARRWIVFSAFLRGDCTVL